MTWLLTDEEWHKAQGQWAGQCKLNWTDFMCQTQLRKVMEEGEKPCPHINYYIPRHSCDKCWQQFKKEAGRNNGN